MGRGDLHQGFGDRRKALFLIGVFSPMYGAEPESFALELQATNDSLGCFGFRAKEEGGVIHDVAHVIDAFVDVLFGQMLYGRTGRTA